MRFGLFLLVTFLAVVGCSEAADGGAVFQAGWFTVNQGRSQHVNIKGLVGDDFRVREHSDQNFLVGAGYYFNGFCVRQGHILCGVNAFYLAPTRVHGVVVQENLYRNLSFHYYRSNWPIYFMAKAVGNFTNCRLSADLGIGPNIVSIHGFKERPLNSQTVPDRIFQGRTTVVFSATAGFSLRFDCVSIDYRFFYLGRGYLKRANHQVLNTLQTGNSYGNALSITISI
jgi:hypothetical protein